MQTMETAQLHLNNPGASAEGSGTRRAADCRQVGQIGGPSESGDHSRGTGTDPGKQTRPAAPGPTEAPECREAI